MCRSILSIDRRFTEVKPRHPRGGPDGGRDIEGIFRGDKLAFGAVGFFNQANDSDKQKNAAIVKFENDLSNTLFSKSFVFFHLILYGHAV